MNLEITDRQLSAQFFDEQPQPAFWMTPVLGPDAEIVDFEYRYCNKEFYLYTGKSPEQIIGNRVSASPLISDPKTRSKLFEELLEVYHTGRKTLSWIKNPTLGKYYSYTRNRVGGGILTVLQDRSQEFKMMNELEEQKRLMDNILLHSSNAISVGEMIRDESGKIIDIRTLLANDAAIQLTGIPKELYLSKSGGELDPNFTTSAYFDLCVRTMITGEPFITQYYLESADKWLEVSVSKMDEERQIYIFTDVTPIKQAQLKLERTSQQLQAIIDRTQSGVFTGAPVFNESGEIIDFRFILVNNTLAAYLRVEPGSLVGRLGSTTFSGYKENGLFDLFCDTYLNDRTNRVDFHYNADGIDAWIDLLCTRFDSEVLVTFTDYTPVKKLQLATESLVNDLKRSNARLEEFAYAASHDLQEPIRKIHTFTDRLRLSLTEKLDPSEEKMFERIQHASLRMSLLVDDLLTFSQVSQPSSSLELVDLNKKVALVISDLELLIDEKKATVVVNELPMVKGYRRQLQQLFQNLFSNSLKYSRTDVAPKIELSSRLVLGADFTDRVPADRREEWFHLITVRDNGIGFEPEHAERIFHLFQRLHGKNEFSGTGVGLSIVQRVVAIHRGFVWAHGEPGQGASFYILLPADQGTGEQE